MIKENILIENLLKSSSIKTLTMNRINFINRRLYILKQPFQVYSGLTGALSAATFKGDYESKRIEKWRDKMITNLGGIEQQASYLESMADFGTLVHESILRAWNNKELDWDYEVQYATEYFKQSAFSKNIPINDDVISQQVFEYCKNASALMQFLFDEVTELYAVEAMCKSDELFIATPVDIVCKLKNGKTATINIKTSSQISNHQRTQIAVEKYMWNNTYDNCKADLTGILRPKDWSLKKGVPTYELEFLKPEQEKELLDSAIGRLKLCLSNSESTYMNFKTETIVFSGKTKLGEKPELKVTSLEELLSDII